MGGVALCVIALFVGWWAVGLGVVLLGWGIAGALGKVRGPLNLVFPESTRQTGLAALGVVLGGMVTTSGAMGMVVRDTVADNIAQHDAEEAKEQAEQEAVAKAEKEERETQAAAAKAAQEAELRGNAAEVASAYAEGLDGVDALIAKESWVEANAKLEVADKLVGEHLELSPVPAEIDALVSRRDTLAATLEVKLREQKIEAWIAAAEGVVGDRGKCEDAELVEAARKPVTGLEVSDVGYDRLRELKAALDECDEKMPPPSEWQYNVRNDSMVGSIGTAVVRSANTLSFDFPYQGEQHATLTVREKGRTDVIVSIERGQFICTLNCSVSVRFDDGQPQRWRAAGPSDYSSETIFLRNESKFVKQLQKARVVRIQAEFFQEGSQVMEFPTSRFDRSQLE